MDHAQRVTLDALYRVLDHLEPNGGWKESRRVVEEGLEAEYPNLAPAFYNPVTLQECELVKKILDMFESLRDSVDALGLQDHDLQLATTFSGFDLNLPEERRLARYAQFKFDQGRWTSQKPAGDINSHMPMLPEYQRMLVAFGSMIDRSYARDFRIEPLTEQEIRTITGLQRT